MRKIILSLASVAALVSCQKEITGDSANGGGGSTGSGLLVKTVAVTGSETITTTYTYDGDKRLYTQTDNGVAGGQPVNSYKRYERDAAGRIVRIVQKLGDVGGVPSDTARQVVYYPNATSTDPVYSVHVKSISMSGITMSNVDSSVYNYTGGKLTSYNSYMSSDMGGMTVPVSDSKWEYTYDASNRVSGIKTFSDAGSPGGPMSQIMNAAITYGAQADNVYASSSAMQNFLMNGTPNAGTANVVTKYESNGMGMNAVITTTHTSSGGKITKATSTTAVTGQPTRTTQYTFAYQ